jgi:hypothetical protein
MDGTIARKGWIALLVRTRMLRHGVRSVSCKKYRTLTAHDTYCQSFFDDRSSRILNWAEFILDLYCSRCGFSPQDCT